jgi:hypothetical protein
MPLWHLIICIRHRHGFQDHVDVEPHDHRGRLCLPSSSLISPALEQLQELPAAHRTVLAGQCPNLASYLAQLPDPRVSRKEALHGHIDMICGNLLHPRDG